MRRLVNRAMRNYRAAGVQDPNGFSAAKQKHWSLFFALGDPMLANDVMFPPVQRGDAAARRAAALVHQRSYSTGRKAVMQWAREWGRR